jgi:hypothetical protein
VNLEPSNEVDSLERFAKMVIQRFKWTFFNIVYP